MLTLKDPPEVPTIGDCKTCGAPIHTDFLWTAKALTDWLGFADRETLRKYDRRGVGPTIQRLPSLNQIRYRHSDVMAWLDEYRGEQHEWETMDASSLVGEAPEDAPASPQDSPDPTPTFSMTDGKRAVRSNG